MTPPIHDREQAVQTVAALLHGDALNVRLVAGRIVDALGIGTTDPEARLWAQDLAQEVGSHESTKYALGDALERAERAEERLRVTDEMTDKVHSRLYPHDPESPDWANRKEWWRWKDVQAALRAVLSNVKDKEND